MASKQNQLVQTLLDQNQQLNATQLANSLGVSVRTVHNYINAVNAQYQDAIVSTPTGYRIAPAMAQQMLHQSPNDIPQNAQDCCTYILNRLVQKGGSMNPPVRLQARTPCRQHFPALTLKKYARMSWMC